MDKDLVVIAIANLRSATNALASASKSLDKVAEALRNLYCKENEK
jgi:hypothetical protein